MHNDYLKILFDYGGIGLTVILLAYFAAYHGYAGVLAVFVLTATIMITDNVFIYYFHQFVCFLVSRALLQEYHHSEISVLRTIEMAATSRFSR